MQLSFSELNRAVRLALIAGCLTLASAADTVGGSGCSSSACVLTNGYVRVGTDTEDVVMDATGQMKQAFVLDGSTWQVLSATGIPPMATIWDVAVATGVYSTVEHRNNNDCTLALLTSMRQANSRRPSILSKGPGAAAAAPSLESCGRCTSAHNSAAATARKVRSAVRLLLSI